MCPEQLSLPSKYDRNDAQDNNENIVISSDNNIRVVCNPNLPKNNESGPGFTGTILDGVRIASNMDPVAVNKPQTNGHNKVQTDHLDSSQAAECCQALLDLFHHK